MMSAVKTLTLYSCASAIASRVTTTSNARITAYFLSDLPFSPFFSFMMLARSTSFLCTGPMLMPDTGMFTSGVDRNDSSASSEPSVLACTHTPSPPLSTLEKMSAMSSMTVALSSSSSSSGPTTNSCVPATACSRPGATTRTPIAALISLWSSIWPLTRISLSTCGVLSALMRVTAGPESVHTTMRSPSRSAPLTSTQSTVVPRPSIVLTSSTVACVSSTNMSRSPIIDCVSLVISWIRSGMPSPLIADVGTTLTTCRGSLFFQ
mmetsp:Transcript_40427/g.120591  ORF Transcript_40427/g.120591 Transcript_40427/m.120591 type:complete len:264 (+) Transcript_40427:938-1729(+)